MHSVSIAIDALVFDFLILELRGAPKSKWSKVMLLAGAIAYIKYTDT